MINFHRHTDRSIIVIFTIFLIISFILCMDVPFFWDAQLKVSRANWIYDTNFQNLIVPTEINSGHPPLWITFLAGSWALFGKSLWASRLLLLIVNWGVYYQLLLLCKKLFSEKVSIWFFFLLCIEATLLAQTTSLNNDMLLLFFVLLSANAIFVNRWWLLTLGLIGLLMTNLRGIYCLLALLIIQLILYKKQLIPASKKMVWAYLISASVFGTFAWYQYSELGWTIISQNKSYAEHRKVGSLRRVLHKGKYFVYHAFEYGRVFLWLPIFAMLYLAYKKYKWKMPSKIMIPLVGLSVFTLLFILGFVPFTNPISPRYLMICYIFGSILFLNLIFELAISKAVRRGLITLLALGFLTGHFWVYPATVDQAWDSSLAYLNYYPVKKDMIAYIDQQQIPESTIGTNLRMRNLYIVPAREPNRQFDFKKLNLDENDYVLFSNMENDTSLEDINTLRSNWIEVQSFSQLGIFMTLYKNPKRD
ncbi:MAG: hypothetical protein R3359_01260 [Marinirhabdus sp.]|nr:hypothetical protein [Marinirhabdus sp.]